MRIQEQNNKNYLIEQLIISSIFRLLLFINYFAYPFLSDMSQSHKNINIKLVQSFAKDPSTATNILSEIKGNRFFITFNRPKRYNAFSGDMYYTLANLIIYANKNEDIKFIVIRGSGGNFSSGNDLGNFMNSKLAELGSPPQLSRGTADLLNQLCSAIINSKKPIFAIVEGKVIGFAFTQLALFDRVFAVEGAQFNAPLVLLAQGPEMCAAYTFPKIFGRNVGEDLLVKGNKVDTLFLEKHGFASRCKTSKEAEQALENHISQLDSLEWNSYLSSRKLFRDIDRGLLLDIARKQCDNLVDRWNNPDLPKRMMEYMAKTKAGSKPNPKL